MYYIDYVFKEEEKRVGSTDNLDVALNYKKYLETHNKNWVVIVTDNYGNKYE